MREHDKRRDYDGRFQRQPNYAGKNLRLGQVKHSEVERFALQQGREALCQCWQCGKVQLLDPDRGELRLACRACGGKVEILTIDGIPQ